MTSHKINDDGNSGTVDVGEGIVFGEELAVGSDVGADVGFEAEVGVAAGATVDTGVGEGIGVELVCVETDEEKRTEQGLITAGSNVNPPV